MGKPARKKWKRKINGSLSPCGRKRQSDEAFTYSQRDELLLFHLGYATYIEYLASPLWAEIRRRVWIERGNRCTLCPSHARTLHHIWYHLSILLGLDTTYIVPLCEKCHVEIEFKANGKKRGLPLVYREYARRLRAIGK